MNDLDQVKQSIDLLGYIENNYEIGKKTKSSGGYLFTICPICHSTSAKKGDNGHFFVNPNTQSYSSFSGCCKGGSIIDFLMEAEKLDKKEAISKAYEIARIDRTGGSRMNSSNSSNKTQTNTNNNTQTQEEIEKEQYIRNQKKQFILDSLAKQGPENKAKAVEYLQSRGISEESSKAFVDKYHLFISSEVYEDKTFGTQGTQRLVIPMYKDNEPFSYVARALTNIEGAAKALNSAGEQIPLNIEYLEKRPPKEDKTIYICEGWADTFSFEDIGKKSIALHSTSNVKKLTNKIDSNLMTASQYTYILCCDNDPAGKKANAELVSYLIEKDIKYYILDIPEEYHDVNDWYVNVGDKDRFKKELNPLKNENVSNYIENSFLNDIERMQGYKSRTTGFKNLDKAINGVIPGLYVIGAISSLGKTTFIHQQADQMASQGEHIIFFSLEQSKFELVAKSVSRQTFLLNNREAVTSLAIMQNTNAADITKKALNNYIPIAENTIIYEGNFNVTVNTIRDYIDNYVTFTGIRPVVILDYLQILSPLSERMTDKQQVDANITELKRISRDYDIPVFVICSFNRENYTTPVDFASFKESGAIEYSADVVMGLQLSVFDELKITGNNKVDVREKLKEAKSETPRKVQLIGLKNRNGKSFFKCEYRFYPQYNYFEEADIDIDTETSVTATRRNNRKQLGLESMTDLPF